ncbi:hypothetical protein ACHAXT_010249 [Thalassiosira profunda]
MQQQPSSDSNGGPAAIAADLFGHTAQLDVASTVSPTTALAEIQAALSALPATEKAALVEAQRLNPHLLNDDHILQFMWAEEFCAPLAAKRLVRYWSDRYRLFGPDKFVSPMTLKGAMRDDSLALSRGYVQLLPETDTAGRAVVYIDWSSHEPSVGYSEESMLRVFWYIAHVAAEDPQIVQRGVVLLIYPQEARLDQFDHSLWSAIAESCSKSLPLRWRSTHIVHPNRFFSIIHPVFMISLDKDVQDRVVVHSGTKMKVLANLLRYLLPWDRIPSEVGGCIDLDFESWVSDRIAKEDQKPAASVSSSIFDAAAALQAGPAAPNAMELFSQMLQPNGGSVPFVNPFEFAQGSAAMMPSASYSGLDSKMADASKSKAAKGPKLIVKSGRKSDPRMDRAVQLKLDDPSLSLLDALREGGFIFPALDDSTTPQYTVVDSDNVKITQRKNQLLRRIRAVKKKAGA